MPGESERPGELIMPFLPVESMGGPFDDKAYASGFEMGRLYVLLEFGREGYWEGLVRTPNLKQADLICMRFNYVIEHAEGDENFTFVRMRRSNNVIG